MDGEDDWVNLLVDDYDNHDLFEFGDNNGNNQLSSCSPLSDIEQHLLLTDHDHNDALLLLGDDDVDRFVQDLLLDSPPQTQSEGLSDLVDNSNNQQPVVVVDQIDDFEDPITKKRKRQLRNKDAALRSRERKKEYVNDLEMKSRYYEGECRRLGSLLQCVMAENQALRFSLHTTSSNKAFNASMTRQESAVLFLESLLLGSLLWLMAIVCQLVDLPQLSQSQLVEEKRLPESPRKQLGSEIRRRSHLLMGKPFKASRSRMRQTVHSLQAVRSNILLSVF